ncbi:MAG: YigZ family protein [Chitinophagales bacterium]|nr:YigZ family protein [Chitinophagales bacterium]
MPDVYTYQTIKDTAESVVKEKGSKFLGFAFQIENEDDIKTYLNEIKNLHPKATHHCYAWRLGLDKNNYRIHDDGEPSGTAGKPILGQIDSLSLTNCLVISVRYFGGTKLGVPGLISAYKLSAKETLENAKIINRELTGLCKIECEYEDRHLAYQFIQSKNGKINRQDLQQRCIFYVEFPMLSLKKMKSSSNDFYPLVVKFESER